jgi:protein TonB
MELKKSEKADLEWRKPTFFQIGLVISLLLVYMAFELIGSREKADPVFIGSGQLITEETMIQTAHEEQQQQQQQQHTVAESLLEIVDNSIRLADFTIDAESTTDLVVEEVVIAPVENTVIEKAEEIPFVVVEEMPEFPGGEEALYKFLSENTVYPPFARTAGIEGRVTIGFVVEPDGRLSNFRVVRSAAPILDEEALRVVKTLPRWKPGKQRGKAVRVQYQIPVIFTLT